MKKKEKNIYEQYKIKKPVYYWNYLQRIIRWRSLLESKKFYANKNENDAISFGTYIERNAEKFGNKIALYYEDQKYSHAEFNKWCNRYANYIQSELGLKKGDVVVVFLENRPEIMFLIAGLAKTGIIVSLINTKQREAALIHAIKLSIENKEKYVFVIGEELVDAFEQIKTNLDIADNLIYFLKEKGEIPPPENYHNLYEKAKDYSSKNPKSTKEILGKDTYSYIFTSGTTGLPKACLMTNATFTGAMQLFARKLMDLHSNDCVYITTPMFHSQAIHVGWSAAVGSGAAVALRRKFSASNFWKDCRKYNVTTFNYIGEICRYLMNQPETKEDRSHKVKKIVGNGLRLDMWKEFKKRFGIKYVYEYYGSTEMKTASFNFYNIDCSVGVPDKGRTALVKYDLEKDEPVRDNNGFMIRVKEGEQGLLLGTVSMDGYYMYTDKKESMKKLVHDVFKKGDLWINTGDMLREIGFRHLQFVDRLGDTFRWKGENVSTLEIETILGDHDQIDLISVFGVEIPGTEGKAGMAAIISKEGPEQFDFKKFLGYAKHNLPRYAIPLFLRFKENLDQTATMKLQKSNLRNHGYDLDQITESIYVYLPKTEDYVKLTREIYNKIMEKKYLF